MKQKKPKSQNKMLQKPQIQLQLAYLEQVQIVLCFQQGLHFSEIRRIQNLQTILSQYKSQAIQEEVF